MSMDEAMFEKYAQHLEWEDFEEEVRRRKTKANVVFVFLQNIPFSTNFCYVSHIIKCCNDFIQHIIMPNTWSGRILRWW
jgi:hypothetical protein